MPKLVLKSTEGLPEEVAKLCIKEGEDHVFDLDAFTGPLRAALSRERENVQNLEQRVAGFKDLDPAKAREALEKVEKMKNWSSDDKVREQIEAKTKELAAAKDTEIKAALDRAEAFRKGYESLTIDKELENALEANKFLAPKLAARLFRSSVRMVEKDGKLVTEVVGSDGKPATITDNQGRILNVTVAEYIAQEAKKPEYAELVKGNPATGSRGANPMQTGQTHNPDGSPKLHNQGDALDKLSKVMTGAPA